MKVPFDIKSNTHQQNVAYGVIGLAVVLAIFKIILPDFLIRPLDWMVLPFADWINGLFFFIKDDLGLVYITRDFAAVIEWLIDVVSNLLYGKNRWPRFDQIPWTVVAASLFILGHALRGWRLSLLSGGTFVWIALLGQWKLAMETLSVLVVVVPFGVFLGLIVGILAWRNHKFERILNPILNIAQSLPHFAYMIPVVVFIGVGPKAGAIVTIIFATPPMIRMVILGLKKVPAELVENGRMCGTNKWQLLRHVWIPSARTELIIGVNQVIMQCLAMVVLASFIGMPGLGYKLLQLLQSLKIGRSIEIGITIVLLAIVLDRCSKAWAYKQPIHFARGTPWHQRNFYWVIWVLSVAILFILAQFWDYAYEIKRTSGFTISKDLDLVVDYIVTQLGPFTYALRGFLIKFVLIPYRNFYLWLPFTTVLLFLGGIGWLIGGRRSAIICFLFFAAIAASGWWDRAMITAYMVSIAVFLAMIMGLPLGIWAARKEKRAKIVLLICDTAQTFPSFIYLIPVIMLFGVNDVAAIGAVVAFGMAPMTRYTIEGLRTVPTTMVEVADMSGASGWQKLKLVQMPIAIPTIMVGLNQCILFSLFMVIIAAFIGTQDLGQEMQRALSSTDVGKGMVLGLCVAFMGLMADHLILLWSEKRKRLLGIE